MLKRNFASVLHRGHTELMSDSQFFMFAKIVYKVLKGRERLGTTRLKSATISFESSGRYNEQTQVTGVAPLAN